MKAGILFDRIGGLAARVSAAALGAAVLSLAAAGPAAAAYDWSAVDSTLAAAAKFDGGGLYITHKGNVVYKKGFKGWTGYTDTQLNQPINVYSVSKTFATVTTMAAINDPNVGMTVDDLVKKWIPNAPTLNGQQFGGVKAYDVMTLRQLMSMTEGSPSYSPITSCINKTGRWTLKTCAESVIKKPLDYKPGTTFNYAESPWIILGHAVTSAVNKAYGTTLSYTGVMTKYLLGPAVCNLSQTLVTPPINEWVGAGVETGLLDGGRFAQALLTRSCGSTTLMSAALRQQMETNQIAGLAMGPNNPAPDNRTYGLGQWRHDQTGSPDTGIYMGIGAGGAVAFYNPSKNYSGFLLVKKIGAARDGMALMEQLVPLINAQVLANP